MSPGSPSSARDNSRHESQRQNPDHESDHSVFYSMREWLSNRHDLVPYFVSHGSRQLPVDRDSLAAPGLPAEIEIRLPASPGTSLRADSGIGVDPESDTGDSNLLSFVERAGSIQHRLRNFSASEEDPDSLGDIKQDLQDLLSDVANTTPSQSHPTSSHDTRRPEYGGIKKRYPSSFSGPSNKRTGKQPTRDAQQRNGEPSVATSKTSRKAKLYYIKCFYHWGCDHRGRLCSKIVPSITALIRHWRTHFCFHCTDCSQTSYFENPDGPDRFEAHKQNHEENRKCILVECPNHSGPGTSHTRRNGCDPWLRVNKERKWKSLFRIALPNTAFPRWDDVLVEVENDAMNGDHDTSREMNTSSPIPENTDFEAAVDTNIMAGPNFGQNNPLMLPEDHQTSWLDQLVIQDETGPTVHALQESVNTLQAEVQQLRQTVNLLMQIINPQHADSVNPADLQNQLGQ